MTRIYRYALLIVTALLFAACQTNTDYIPTVSPRPPDTLTPDPALTLEVTAETTVVGEGLTEGDELVVVEPTSEFAPGATIAASTPVGIMSESNTVQITSIAPDEGMAETTPESGAEGTPEATSAVEATSGVEAAVTAESAPDQTGQAANARAQTAQAGTSAAQTPGSAATAPGGSATAAPILPTVPTTPIPDVTAESGAESTASSAESTAESTGALMSASNTIQMTSLPRAESTAEATPESTSEATAESTTAVTAESTVEMMSGSNTIQITSLPRAENTAEATPESTSEATAESTAESTQSVNAPAPTLQYAPISLRASCPGAPGSSGTLVPPWTLEFTVLNAGQEPLTLEWSASGQGFRPITGTVEDLASGETRTVIVASFSSAVGTISVTMGGTTATAECGS